MALPERRVASGRLLPALLFGLRAAAAAMLALFIAFSLRLDQPGWAATSAVIVAQPILGATLRKGLLRLFGTATGACAGVLLFSAFPQDRVGFLLGLAAWGGLCSAAATLLGELLSYAPLLAGYTTAIVAMSAVSDPPEVLLLAVARGAAISIGITCTAVVFALTTQGRQRGVLATSIEAAAREALAGLRAALGNPAPDAETGKAARRALVARVAGLDAVLDQASGENLDLRSRIGVVRRAIAGLLIVLSSWRGVEQHRRSHAAAEACERAEQRLQAALARAGGEPRSLLDVARDIEDGGSGDASERLLLDRVAHGLDGLAAVEAGLRLLRDPLRFAGAPGLLATRLRNPWSALSNGLRSFCTVALAAGVWLATGWDQGPTFVIFAMVVVVLFGTRDETAFSGAVGMALSCGFALAIAAVIRFALMPAAQGHGLDGFATLCVLIGGPLTALGMMAAALPAGRPAAVLAFMIFANLMPLLSPTNEITYDFGSFLDGGLAILGGATLGAAAHRLWPPLSRALRTTLFLRGARRDLRRIASGAWRPDTAEWEARQYARLVGLPPGASPLDHGRLLAALSVGRELLRRRRWPEWDAARRGASALEIDEAMASHPDFFKDLGLSASVGG